MGNLPTTPLRHPALQEEQQQHAMKPLRRRWFFSHKNRKRTDTLDESDDEEDNRVVRLGATPSSLAQPQQQRQQNGILTSSKSTRRSTKHTNKPYMFGTLVLRGWIDVEHALQKDKTQGRKSRGLLPKTILVAAKFLNTLHAAETQGVVVDRAGQDVSARLNKRYQRRIRRVLRQGCLQLQLAGRAETAPRRVFDVNLAFVLERSRPDLLEGLVLQNLHVQSWSAANNNTPVEATANNNNNNNKSATKDQLRKLTQLKVLHITSSRIHVDLLHDIVDLLAGGTNTNTKTTHKKNNKQPQQVVCCWPLLEDIALQLVDLAPSQQQAIEQALVQRLQLGGDNNNDCSCIRKLQLSFYPQTEALWKAMAECQTLTSLSLQCHNNDPSTTTTATTRASRFTELQDLLTGRTSPGAPCVLENLQLWLTPPPTPAETATTAPTMTTTALAANNAPTTTPLTSYSDICQSSFGPLLQEGLQHNTSLKTLHVRLYDDHDYDNEVEEEDEDNTKTVSLAMQCSQWFVEGPDGLQAVLEDGNFTLQNLTLDVWSVPHGRLHGRVATPILDFYTQHLNQNGRHHLLRAERSSMQDWIRTLAGATSRCATTTGAADAHGHPQDATRLSAIYYWLRAQPNHMATLSS